MDDQETKNQEESFIRHTARQGKDKLKDEGKKQSKKKIVQLIAKNPKVMAAIAIVILAFIVLIVLLVGFGYLLDLIEEEEVNQAKNSSVTISYDGETGITENTKIVIKPTTDDTYKISNIYTDEEFEKIKSEIAEQTNIGISNFSHFEIAFLGSLFENGVDLDNYTTEELHCLPYFLKAESATQFLDLRKNSQKFDSQGNYMPELLEDLEEEEVSGVILVQRTNTNDNNPVPLEYIEKAEFDEMVNNNDIDVINYFTMSDKGNLLIAKWDHIKVKVEGEYPDSLSEEEKETERDENIISTEEIAYSQYVKKYTMPFDFLVQLLVITNDPDFCNEVADIVLGSKIVINIQEEETYTETTKVQTYTIHNKEEKRVNYIVTPNIESSNNYFLNKTTDDEGNACTTYETETKTVTVTTEYTSHSYAFEIIEADTWLAHYIKTYKKQTVQGPETTKENLSESKGQYEEGKETVITDTNQILSDSDVKEFKEQQEEKYKGKITTPIVQVVTHTNEGISNRTYKEIVISPQNTFDISLSTYKFDQKVSQGANGETIYTYDMPKSFTVTTKATTDFPARINFIYTLNEQNYQYSLANTDKDNVLKCDINKLTIKPFSKIDINLENDGIDNYIITEVTKYPSDPNPKTNTHIYATKSGQPGNGYEFGNNVEYEKFLIAYDNHKDVRNMINSISSWLYKMMEENENTVNMVDTVKYLLYMYDGKNRGVTELDLSLFDGNEFVQLSNGTGWWWPIGSSTTETINGVVYAKGDPVATTITSGVGPRWGKNHGGIDIAGPRNTNIIASKSGTVIKVTDGFGDGYYGSKDGGGYGNHIKIQHDDGTYSIYAHLQNGTIRVSEGDYVEQGQLIAQMGTSGSSTGVHLHFEIRDANNNRLDPEEYVDPDNPRPTVSSSQLKDWLWGIEGGSQYINGNIWTVFDPEGSDDTMNLAHGMVIASYNGADSWYPDIIPGKITAGQTVTEEQANKIWEIKIAGFYDAINSACAKYGVTLTSNQKDALVSYIYRTGYGNGQNNKLVEAYKNGGNVGLWGYMKNGYNRNYEVGTKSRIAEEYELFVKGDYNYNPNNTVKYDQYCANPNI